MRIAMVGLGRMGANMVRRLLRDGHECVVYDVVRGGGRRAWSARAPGRRRRSKELVDAARRRRARCGSCCPRPSPAATVTDCSTCSSPATRSSTAATRPTATTSTGPRLAAVHDVDYVDCGTSGGVWGLERGYCLMIGGPDRAVERLDPVFASLAPGVGAADAPRAASGEVSPAEQGYLHCGPSGAGHFVKMVHNGIEYAPDGRLRRGAERHPQRRRRQAPARRPTPRPHRCASPSYYPYDGIDLAEVAEVWRRGSVIGSWLLDLTAEALAADPRAGAVLRPGLRLRRGPLDVDRGDRGGRPGAAAHRRALQPVRLARERAVRRQGASRRSARSSAATTRSGRHDDAHDRIDPRPGPAADALVLFGVTGDLARKMILPALYRLTERGELTVPVIGVARSDWSSDELRKHVGDASGAAVPDVDGAVLERLQRSVHMVAGDYNDPTTFERLADDRARAGRAGRLRRALPGRAARAVRHGGRRRSRPWGCTERAGWWWRSRSATTSPRPGRSNAQLRRHVPEERLFRVDHYLGKEPVEDLLVLRFANTLLEPLWNRTWIDAHRDHDGRGLRRRRPRLVLRRRGHRSRRGAEPPAAGARATSRWRPAARHRRRPARREVHRSCVPCGRWTRPRWCAGSTPAIATWPGVAPDSTTETYVALTLHIDNWRWAGVPVHIRAGKAMPETVLDIVVMFRPPPRRLFHGEGRQGARRPTGSGCVCSPTPESRSSCSRSSPAAATWRRSCRWRSTSGRCSARCTRRTSGSSPTRSPGTPRTSPGWTTWRRPGGSSDRSSTRARRPCPTPPARGARRDRRQGRRSPGDGGGRTRDRTNAAGRGCWRRAGGVPARARPRAPHRPPRVARHHCRQLGLLPVPLSGRRRERRCLRAVRRRSRWVRCRRSPEHPPSAPAPTSAPSWSVWHWRRSARFSP